MIMHSAHPEFCATQELEQSLKITLLAGREGPERTGETGLHQSRFGTGREEYGQ